MGSHRVRHDRSDLAHMHASNKEGGKTNTGGRLFYKGDFPKVKAFKTCSLLQSLWGFPGDAVVKNPSAMQKTQDTSSISWAGKIPWSRIRQPTPVFLLGKPRGQRSLAGYIPWGWKELGTNQASGLY